MTYESRISRLDIFRCRSFFWKASSNYLLIIMSFVKHKIRCLTLQDDSTKKIFSFSMKQSKLCPYHQKQQKTKRQKRLKVVTYYSYYIYYISGGLDGKCSAVIKQITVSLSGLQLPSHSPLRIVCATEQSRVSCTAKAREGVGARESR